MRTKHWKRALWDSFLGMLRSQLFAAGGGMEGKIVLRSSLAVTNIVSVIESCKSNFILCFPQLAGSTHVTTPTDFLASLRELAGWIYCEGTSWQHLRAMQTFLFLLITIFCIYIQYNQLPALFTLLMLAQNAMQPFRSRNLDRLNFVFVWILVAESSRVDKRQIFGLAVQNCVCSVIKLTFSASSRLSYLEMFSVLILSILNHPCSFMFFCYLFGVFLCK